MRLRFHGKIRSYMARVLKILISIAIFSALAACSGAEPTDPAQTDAPITIHATLNNILQAWEGQTEFEDEFQRLTAAALEITQPPHQSYSERVYLQLASDRVPDVAEVLSEHLPVLIRGNLVLPLDDFIAGSQYLQSIKPGYLERMRHPDGHIYAIPARDGGGCVAFIRKDWLDRLGLEIPGSWDELVAVMEAFTFQDPDGNGIDDTYGYTDVAAMSQDWYNRLLMGKGRIEIYYDDNLGQWVDGFTGPETQAALRRIKEIYDRGLIDPHMLTHTTFSARTKFINGQAGIFTYWANHWALNLQERTVAAADPQADVVPIPPFADLAYINRVAPALVITRSAGNPQEVFRLFIDMQYDKGPVQTLFTYGVEGTHWAEEQEGMRMLPNPQDPYGGNYTKSYVPPGSIINDWDPPLPPEERELEASRVLAQSMYLEKQRWGGEYYEQYFIALEQELKSEVLTAYWTGKLSLEEAMAEYREKAARLYLDRILEELNTGG